MRCVSEDVAFLGGVVDETHQQVWHHGLPHCELVRRGDGVIADGDLPPIPRHNCWSSLFAVLSLLLFVATT